MVENISSVCKALELHGTGLILSSTTTNPQKKSEFVFIQFWDDKDEYNIWV